MQIVIDIPDYSIPQNNGLLELQLMCFRGEIGQCSFPFKVLPKGHGRLIDADAFERRCMFDSDIEDMQDVIYALRDYKSIIEADKGENEEL